MGSLKVPALLANVNDDPLTAVRPAGRLTHDPIGGALAIHDGTTPGGDRVNRWKAAGVGSVERILKRKLDEMAKSPEDFGAIGDGVANDGPAINRALAAIKATGLHGRLILTAGRTYYSTETIVLDRVFHTLEGYATLRFPKAVGVCVQVSSSASGDGIGLAGGAFEGAVRIDGGGAGNDGAVGIRYHTPTVAVATAIRTIGVCVANCHIAYQSGDRGYCQEFYNCSSNNVDYHFDLAPGDDNAERWAVFGGTFYNGGTVVRSNWSAGDIFFYGASFDYTYSLVEATNASKVIIDGCHIESSVWTTNMVTVSGDNTTVIFTNTRLIMIANPNNVLYFAKVGAGCVVKMLDCITNGFSSLTPADALSPTTWANGPGRFEISGHECNSNLGTFPARTSSNPMMNTLVDPDIASGALGQDMMWRTGDTNPIQDRYGSVIPAPAIQNNIVLTAAMDGGNPCLKVQTAFGETTTKSFVLIAMPIVGGRDKVIAGFRVRFDAANAPAPAGFLVSTEFIKLDGYDQYGVPKIAKRLSQGNLNFLPTSAYKLLAFSNSSAGSETPAWATHYIVHINFVIGGGGTYYFKGMWANRM